jgi:hypothetical protein
MAKICIVYFGRHDRESDTGMDIIGVFTTRTLALEAIRAKVSHEDDDGTIVETELNQSDPSFHCIYDVGCDRQPDIYWQFYARHWPTGYPLRKRAD